MLMRPFIILLCLALFLAACGNLPSAEPTAVPTTYELLPTSTKPAIDPTAAATTRATDRVESITPVPSSPEPTSEPPTLAPISGIAETARAATARELVDVIPPLRDDLRLAIAYRGVNPVMATPPAAEDEVEVVGSVERFFIGNVDSNTVSQIEAELVSVGENAYFWFDTGDGSVEPDPAALAAATESFDAIFDRLFEYFGISEPPGGRVHIVHASPQALCDAVDRCRLAGYFSSRDLLPVEVNPQSNERAMFVMNTQQFGGTTYLDVLSHELRHMLGDSYDAGDEDWFVEGAAMLAEDLVGFTTLPQARGSLFLQQPDQQLNSWTDGDTIPHYGQGYLLNRFLYDWLGEDLYREFSLNPRPGLSAVDEVALANDLGITGEELWLDWLVAMAIHENQDVPEIYRWDGPELEPVITEAVNNLPTNLETTVSQFAADYYELPSSGTVKIDFSGAPTIPLLGSDAPSGEQIWYAQRANYSNPRLTRSVDLRDVSAATLQYQAYVDIEHGYDFAYVAVSTDGGQSWIPLEAGGMQGILTEDDPSGSALAGRFYSGRLGEWIDESIDLSPYAGRELLLRFEYVTDPILTFGGFALDDIAIPEIGFFDDAESLDAGWTAEGFTRATTDLPQAWRLQLITFDSDGRPTVERLPVAENGRGEHIYQGVPGVRRPLLIVSSVVPETLEVAPYSLEVAAP